MVWVRRAAYFEDTLMVLAVWDSLVDNDGIVDVVMIWNGCYVFIPIPR